MFVFILYALCIISLVNVAEAQNRTQATTDPNEGELSLHYIISQNVVALFECIQFCCIYLHWVKKGYTIILAHLHSKLKISCSYFSIKI